MKKNLLLACGGALLFTAATAQTYTRQLEEWVSSDDLERETYFYNADNTLQYFLHEEFFTDGSTFYDKYTYDGKGHIILDETYQDLEYTGEMEDMILVSKCEYTYDENGNLKTRDNFNKFGNSDLEQSARIVYTYDKENRCTSEIMYWAFDLNTPFMQIDYNYDKEGRLDYKLEYADSWEFPGELFEIGKYEYVYDHKGRLAQTNYWYTDEYEPWLADSQVFYYDDNDNVVKAERFANGGELKTRNTYEYSDESCADVLYPKSVEFQLHEAFGIKNNVRTVEGLWLAADDVAIAEDGLFHYLDYYYYYCDRTNALTNVAMPVANIRFEQASKSLSFGGRGVADVRVIGQDGKTVCKTTAKDGRADLSSLAPGVYVVSVKESCASPVYQKFVVR